MAERNTSVSYRALAHFTNLKKELRDLRNEIAKTRAAEKAHNLASGKERAAATRASTARATALKNENKNLREVLTKLSGYSTRLKTSTVNVRASNKAINAQNRALATNTARLLAASEAAKKYSRAQRNISRDVVTGSSFRDLQKQVKSLQDAQKAQRENTEAVRENSIVLDRTRRSRVRFVKDIGEVNTKTGEVIRTVEEGARRSNIWRRRFAGLGAAFRSIGRDGDKLPPIFSRIERGGNRVHRSFVRIGNWRPRFVPPFIALVPLIGAVIAAINPLIAVLGSLGAVAIGLAGQIGSLSGAFLALPGILSAVVSGITSVIASMGGVGNVFKTYSAMQKATNSANSGKTQAERADDLARAEHNLAKAQRNVKKAQEGLNKAREEALEDLIQLRLEVSRADMSEERAIANLRQAQEAYWNAMADPGSTLGDKLDAAVAIKEAEADLEDVRKKNIQNQKDLVEAEKKGIENSDKVIDAQERLTDSIYSQRDAQRALKDEQAGGSGAVQAVNEYRKALDELSPSARTFVLAIIGMQDQWKAFRKDMQESFFSRFVGEVGRLPRLLQTLTSFLRPSAKAMGDFVGNLLRMLDSPAWRADMSTIGEQNATVIRNLGDAALSLSTALKDIIIAAGPFTEWLTGAFARGAQNFSDFIADARETGRLAEWLEKVEGRLSKWWEIIKNIGATIFNYSAAAENFGNWITDGFLEMTENWRKASEEALEPGSKFQTFLEDIKPLLEEIDGLLGDFFSWFAREAADKGNIESATNLMKLIRDDLGPALGELLDTLSETDIDEKFVKALTSIIDALDSLLENGGADGFEAFFDIIIEAFNAIADFFDSIPQPILQGFLQVLGLLAGIIFVGKFTGLTKLFGKILSFTPTLLTGLTAMFGSIKGLNGLTFSSLVGKTGLLGLLLALAGTGAKNVQENMDTWKQIFENAGETDPKKRQENSKNIVKNGAGIKAALGPNPLNPMGAINLGAVSDVLGFLGTIPGGGIFKDWQKGLDSWLEDISQGLVDWGEDLARNWPKIAQDMEREWGNFWEDSGKNWENFWSGLGKSGENGWTQITNFFSRDVPSFFETIGQKFENGWKQIVDGFTTVWDGIREAFAAPINFVLDKVYNHGLRSFWNDIVKNLNLPKGLTLPAATMISTGKKKGGAGGGRVVARAEGGVLPGWSPGSDIHTFTSPTGGTLKLSGGEAIMRPEFTKMVGGERGVNEINRKARNGQAFANGGVIDFGGDVLDNLGGFFKSIVGGITGFFSDPVGSIVKSMSDIVKPLLPKIPGGRWGDVVGALPGKLISGLGGVFKKNYAESPAGGGAPANALGWQTQWRIIQQKFPYARLHSGFRNPIQNAAIGGVPGSYHTQGRAIDVTPSMQIFDWLRKNFPNSRELIYSPAGNRQLRNGQNYFWGEPVRSDHFDHVHWAMRKGGVWPGVYDNGGWLPHGGMAINASGKPEAVLDPQESRALKALLSGAGLKTGSPSLAASTRLAAQQAANTTINDYSINVEKLELVNPVPEKMSESLPKTIRRIGYMNQARANAK